MTTLTINPALRAGLRQGQIRIWEPEWAEPGVLNPHDLERLYALGELTEAQRRAWRAARLLVERDVVPEPVAEIDLPDGIDARGDLPPRL